MLSIRILPNEIISYIRKFLSVDDFWGSNILSRIVWWHTQCRFPLYYNNIKLNRAYGIRWRRMSLSRDFHSYYHRTLKDKVKFVIDIDDDCRFYSITVLPNWKNEFTDYEMMEIDDYFFETYPDIPTIVSNRFVELIFYQDINAYSRFNIDASPLHLFLKCNSMVKEIKQNIKF